MDLVNAVTLVTDVVLIAFSIPGNLLIVAVCYAYSRRSTTDLLIGFQAAVDFLAAVPSCLSVVMVTHPASVDQTFCRIKLFALRYVRYTSLFFMAAIALDRYRVVYCPAHQRWSWKAMQIYIVSILCNVLGVVVSFPAVFVFVPYRSSSGVRCVRSLDQLPYFDEMYPIVTSLLFFIAMLVSSLLYMKIYRFIHAQNRIRAVMNGPTVSRSRANHGTDAPSTKPDCPDRVQGNVVIRTVSNALHDTTPTSSQEHGRFFPSCSATNIKQPVPLSNRLGGEEIMQLSLCEATPQVRKAAPLRVPTHPHSHGILRPQSRTLPIHACCAPPEGGEDNHQDVRGTFPSHRGHVLVDSRFQRTTGKARRRHFGAGRDRQTTYMLFVITIIFFLSWFPGIIATHIPSDVMRRFREKNINNLVVSVAYSLRNFNHIVNIFIYALISRRFKQQCVQVIRRVFSKWKSAL